MYVRKINLFCEKNLYFCKGKYPYTVRNIDQCGICGFSVSIFEMTVILEVLRNNHKERHKAWEVTFQQVMRSSSLITGRM